VQLNISCTKHSGEMVEELCRADEVVLVEGGGDAAQLVAGTSSGGLISHGKGVGTCRHAVSRGAET